MGCHPPASVLWHEVVVLWWDDLCGRILSVRDAFAAPWDHMGPQLSLPSRQKNALRWRLSSGHVSSNATSRVMSRVLRPSPPLQSPAMDMADLAQTSIQERIIH
jgi:hypothetical protein